MPRIFGLNLLGLLATSVAFFFLGFIWYDVVFDQQWLALMHINPNAAAGPIMLPLVMGYVNVLVVSLGIGLLLKWLKVSKLVTAVKYGLMVAVCFALTSLAYDMIYAGTSKELFMLNGAYDLIGYSMVAAIWTFFD